MSRDTPGLGNDQRWAKSQQGSWLCSEGSEVTLGQTRGPLELVSSSELEKMHALQSSGAAKSTGLVGAQSTEQLPLPMVGVRKRGLGGTASHLASSNLFGAVIQSAGFTARGPCICTPILLQVPLTMSPSGRDTR